MALLRRRHRGSANHGLSRLALSRDPTQGQVSPSLLTDSRAGLESPFSRWGSRAIHTFGAHRPWRPWVRGPHGKGQGRQRNKGHDQWWQIPNEPCVRSREDFDNSSYTTPRDAVNSTSTMCHTFGPKHRRRRVTWGSMRQRKGRVSVLAYRSPASVSHSG